MTIKKRVDKGAAGGASGGSAAIADRFKLDAAPQKKAVGGKGLTCAFIAALAALGVAGILTYVIYKHWEFLMPA